MTQAYRIYVRFQVLTAASMKFRFVFWDIIALMMEAARTSETWVDNYFTRQYIPEDKSKLSDLVRWYSEYHMLKDPQELHITLITPQV
jgi:hypothetical protein